MKAVIQQEFGDASVLAYTDVDLPEIGENEVLIKVAYMSVNYADIKKRTGNKGNGEFPLILGLDVAGTIEDVPPKSNFSKGERVIAFPKSGCIVPTLNYFNTIFYILDRQYLTGQKIRCGRNMLAVSEKI